MNRIQISRHGNHRANWGRTFGVVFGLGCFSALTQPTQATINKVNVVRSGPGGTSNTATINLDLPSGAVASSGCPTVIAGMVVGRYEYVDILQLLQDGDPLAHDFVVAEGHMALLEKKFEEAGVFDSDVNSLFFIRLFPDPCQGLTTVAAAYTVSDGKALLLQERFVAGGSDLADLEDGEPVSNFALIDESIRDAQVPTVSTWGALTMAMLLLAGGKIYFGRRRQVDAA